MGVSVQRQAEGWSRALCLETLLLQEMSSTVAYRKQPCNWELRPAAKNQIFCGYRLVTIEVTHGKFNKAWCDAYKDIHNKFYVALFVSISQPVLLLHCTNGCGQHACVPEKEARIRNVRVTTERERKGWACDKLEHLILLIWIYTLCSLWYREEHSNAVIKNKEK